MNSKNKKLRYYILAIPLTIFVVTGMINPIYGPKVFDTKSLTIEGENIIRKWNIKFINKDVYRIYWFDIYKSKEGVFATQVKQDFFGRNISFVPIKNKYITKYKLVPKYSFFEKYSLIFLLLFAGIFIYFLIYYKNGGTGSSGSSPTGFNNQANASSESPPIDIW